MSKWGGGGSECQILPLPGAAAGLLSGWENQRLPPNRQELTGGGGGRVQPRAKPRASSFVAFLVHREPSSLPREAGPPQQVHEQEEEEEEEEEPRLSAENKQLKSQNQEKEEPVSHLPQEVQELEREVSPLQQKMQELKEQVSRLCAKNQQLKQQNQEKDKPVSGLLQELKEQVSRLQQEVQALKGEVSPLQQEVKEHKKGPEASGAQQTTRWLSWVRSQILPVKGIGKNVLVTSWETCKRAVPFFPILDEDPGQEVFQGPPWKRPELPWGGSHDPVCSPPKLLTNQTSLSSWCGPALPWWILSLCLLP
uniref:Uncharacterized protein isoform X2 n=1 Tax=Pogona vitticeps TaxID=103695 RepID=A0ABM5F9J3_9SAUR